MTHIQQRRDTAAAWTAANPVLFEGEAGHETNTGKWKLGDGATAWNALPYKPGVMSVAGKTGVVTLTIADVAGAIGAASPALTGNPTAPTPNPADNDTSIATTAFVQAQKISPTFTGIPIAPTALPAVNNGQIATTAYVKSVVAAQNIGVWQTFAPAIAPETGAWANASPSNGRWVQNGKTVHFTVQINIISAGTAGGSFSFTLPVNARTGSWNFLGREIAATGYAAQALSSGGSQAVAIVRYDGVSIIGSGRSIVITGTYEAA